MPLSLALYQPDIAQNTGTLIRLAACLDFQIHIIHPTGFTFSQSALRRSGMDYVELANIVEHDSFDQFETWRRDQAKRLVLLSTKATQSAYEATYTDDDILMVGRESAGVPEKVAHTSDLLVRIPMAKGLRSINVALSATLIMGEAKRQTDGFRDLT
jgi:tRNA (cytidine/uridine-2'-O-)-methyltransferase